MLTPAEITGKEFKRALFTGYEMAGVDEFLEELLGDYTALYKENGILKNKLKVLVEKIEEYRSTEDSMRMALLTAQKTGEDLVAAAQQKGAEITEQMETTAAARRAELADEIADEQARLEAAARETGNFVSAVRELIATHTDFLSRLSSIRREREPEPTPTREEEIRGAAREIDSAVAGIVAPAQEQTPDDEGEPTKRYPPGSPAGLSEDERRELSPRPKKEHKNLAFGINFEGS
ncbi:MAG: DivIVA domain-containing protein [Oscillospiraceae bacterium]|jgi:cell division initiation protein|nr:DivIVA domain-containing protein [Oscillospiraceae bacterium]